jgi:hypothetical protein
VVADNAHNLRRHLGRNPLRLRARNRSRFGHNLNLSVRNRSRFDHNLNRFVRSPNLFDHNLNRFVRSPNLFGHNPNRFVRNPNLSVRVLVVVNSIRSKFVADFIRELIGITPILIAQFSNGIGTALRS